ncbi:MAG: hypothetical protein NC113_04755 [Bacteroides sp.]|nr:hypothetical protein [Bacteroides sp.]MCM1447518.1 hypothetical protein [Bacteroides sp.]
MDNRIKNSANNFPENESGSAMKGLHTGTGSRTILADHNVSLFRYGSVTSIATIP